MRLVAWIPLALAACGGGDDEVRPDSGVSDTDAGADSAMDVTGPGVYRETCDGSGAIALDPFHFADVNDEDQVLRVYKRGMDAGPVQTFNMNAALGLAGTAEADLEDLALIGSRMFAITSHGRKASGLLDRARYKFTAFDVAGAVPNLTFTHVGNSGQLLDEMLVASNWDAPNNDVIAALSASSNLSDGNDGSLAPEDMGTNIEALASDGQGHLLIGFRNPRPGGGAIVVSLVNPDETVTGTTARFGGAGELDLGGLGIRSMTRTQTRGILIVAGPHNSGGPFKLYRWTGSLADAPVFVVDLAAAAFTAPEAVVEYADTTVQVIFDEGDAEVGGITCKDLTPSARLFHDIIVTVP